MTGSASGLTAEGRLAARRTVAIAGREMRAEAIAIVPARLKLLS